MLLTTGAGMLRAADKPQMPWDPRRWGSSETSTSHTQVLPGPSRLNMPTMRARMQFSLPDICLEAHTVQLEGGLQSCQRAWVRIPVRHLLPSQLSELVKFTQPQFPRVRQGEPSRTVLRIKINTHEHATSGAWGLERGQKAATCEIQAVKSSLRGNKETDPLRK